MDLTPALIAATATLVAAALAATISLIVTILSKEQKTSEFRQQWVDALRNDVAEFVAEVDVLGSASNHEIKSDDDDKFAEYVAKRYGNLLKTQMLLARIKLRLNKTKHVPLINALDALEAAVTAPQDVLQARGKDVLDEAAIVLKDNWERVKKGEPAFYLTKRAAIAIVTVALLSIAVLVVRAWGA